MSKVVLRIAIVCLCVCVSVWCVSVCLCVCVSVCLCVVCVVCVVVIVTRWCHFWAYFNLRSRMFALFEVLRIAQQPPPGSVWDGCDIERCARDAPIDAFGRCTKTCDVELSYPQGRG